MTDDRNAPRLNRRRLIAAGLFFFGGAGFARAEEKTSGEKLPPCSRTKVAGNWVLDAGVFSIGDTVSSNVAFYPLSGKWILRTRKGTEEFAFSRPPGSPNRDIGKPHVWLRMENDDFNTLFPSAVAWTSGGTAEAKLGLEHHANFGWDHIVHGRRRPLNVIHDKYYVGDKLIHHKTRDSKKTKSGKTRWTRWYYVAGRTEFKEKRWIPDPTASFDAKQFLSWGDTLRFAFVDRAGYVTGKKGTEFFEISSELSGLEELIKDVPQIVSELYKDRRAKVCGPPPGGGGPDCFLTTACCQVVGLDDDCWELSQMRRLRDWMIENTPSGRNDVDRYYEMAPRIIGAFADEPRTAQIYRRLYVLYIVPCAALTWLGFARQARSHYFRMLGRTRAMTGI